MIPRSTIHKTTSKTPSKYISKKERKLLEEKSKLNQEDGIIELTNDYKNYILPNEDLKADQLKTFSQNEFPNSCFIQYNDHKNQVNHVRWNPIYGNLLASCSMDSKCYIYSVFPNKGQLIKISHKNAIKDVRWGLNGTYVYTGSIDHTVQMTDIEKGKIIHTFEHNDWITSVCVHPSDSSLFLAGSGRNGIVAWDNRTNKVIHIYKHLFGEVEDMMFLDNDGKIFVSACDVIRRNSMDKGLIAWDFNDGIMLSNQIYMEGYNLASLSKHPNESKFICQTTGNYIIECSSIKPFHMNKKKRFEGHQTISTKINCKYSHDGHVIATGSTDGGLYYYNSSTTSIIYKKNIFDNPLIDIDYHPIYSHILACCDSTGSIKILNHV